MRKMETLLLLSPELTVEERETILKTLDDVIAREGGKSILCLPSTASKGTKSRIVAQFGPGTVVTASRYDVMYVVTEFGIAQLKGKTMRERARALILIAHPNFRDELCEEFKYLGSYSEVI